MANWDHLDNFSRGHEEHFCEIILNLDQRFRNCNFKIFLFYSSDGHLYHLDSFGIGHYGEHFCEII